MLFFQHFNMVKPELIFHENSRLKIKMSYQTMGVCQGVERHISH